MFSFIIQYFIGNLDLKQNYKGTILFGKEIVYLETSYCSQVIGYQIFQLQNLCRSHIFYYRLLTHFRLTYFKFFFNVPFLPWLYDVFGGIEGNIGLIWVNDQTHKGCRRVEYHLHCGCSLLFLPEPIDLSLLTVQVSIIYQRIFLVHPFYACSVTLPPLGRSRCQHSSGTVENCPARLHSTRYCI